MPRVTLDQDQVATRGPSLSTLLSPLLQYRKQGGPGRARQSIQVRGVTGIVWAAHDGTTPFSYRDWRFPIFLSGFRGQYFEIWLPLNPQNPRSYYLLQSYLNIYKNVEEYICLHCDPEESDSVDGRGRYKQGPHLHIKAAHEPIPRAHLALAHDHLQEILSTERDLFKAMKLGIELIRDEVLARQEDSA